MTTPPCRTKSGLPLLAALLIVLAPGGATAQESGPGLVLGLAYETGGPGESLIVSLIEADLGDEKPERCFTYCERMNPLPADYPSGLELAASIGARYRFPGALSLEGVLSNGARGHTTGYNDSQRREVTIGYASFLLSTTVGLHVGPLGLHAGPIIRSTRWERAENAIEVATNSSITVGGTAALSATIPLDAVSLALRSGVRLFPVRKLDDEIGMDLSAGYQAFYIGVTATGRSD